MNQFSPVDESPAHSRRGEAIPPLPPVTPPPVADPSLFFPVARSREITSLSPASRGPTSPKSAGKGASRNLPDKLSTNSPPTRLTAPVKLRTAEAPDITTRLAQQSELPPIKPTQQAPPWLISLLVHMTILLGLGLLWIPDLKENVLQVTAIFAEKLGAQTKIETPSVEMNVPQPEDPVVTPEDLPPVESPRLEPEPLPKTAETAPLTFSELKAPEVGLALSGREAGMKKMLLAAYGGNALTEEAVTEGLEWLKRNQQRDGTWKLSGPYNDGLVGIDNPTAATSMALLAFLGAGHTHQAGKYRTVVSKGLKALIKMQGPDGDFWKRGSIGHHRLYSQAQAMITVCELYGMTKDSQVRLAAERAVDYAVKSQDSLGGWRYQPGFDSDTSVTGWFMMGLQSARMAGIDVPSDTLERIHGYLDRVASPDQARYGYQPGKKEGTYAMTAEALLCRQYLGWPKDDPRLATGVNLILSRPINWEDRDVYYWYYATQVLHHLHDERWHEWNDLMRQVLPENQTKTGPERGSWTPLGDEWGPAGGRLYVTCLSLYMLEVYYRHLPIYQ